MTTYAQLQADIVETIKDSQVDAAKTQDFIRYAEYKLQRDLLDSRYGGSVPHQMLVSVMATTDSDSAYTLPADFLKEREVAINGIRARYVSPGTQIYLYGGTGIDAESANFVLQYYQALSKLTDINTTNWLLSAGYDCYMWAACLQYAPWGQEIESLPLWREMYADALQGVKATYGAQPRGGFSANKPKGRNAHYTISDGKLRFVPTAGETP